MDRPAIDEKGRMFQQVISDAHTLDIIEESFLYEGIK